MDLKFAFLLAAAWLRLHLQSRKWPPSEGALAWRWSLGIKQDSYGYTLAIYRVKTSMYVLRLIRSQGASTELRSSKDLQSVVRVAQLLHREYGKAARIADERDLRTLAELAA